MDVILTFTKNEVKGFKIKKEFEQTGGNIKVERGDVVLLRRTSDNMITNLFTSPKPSYHAGICKGDDQIVHLTESGGGILQSRPGNICIQKVNGFTSGKEFRILQKVDGVPDSFDADVINAMDSDDHHEESRHNCIDFVLKLLKVDPEEIKLCPQQQHEVVCSAQNMDISVFAEKEVRGFKIKKEFEQTEGNVKVERGDIVLLRRTSDNMVANLFTSPKPSYHAGICKGDDQIVHLAESGGGILQSRPGNICIQKVNGFTSGKEFRILQKVDGVPDSFDADVINAMDSDDQHEESRHNCIDFVLKLLKVDPETYKPCGGLKTIMQPNKKPDEDGATDNPSPAEPLKKQPRIPDQKL